MQEHEIRVVNEKSDLDLKIKSLAEFMHGDVYATMPKVGFGLMMMQLNDMKAYSKTLGRRIELFNGLTGG